MCDQSNHLVFLCIRVPVPNDSLLSNMINGQHNLPKLCSFGHISHRLFNEKMKLYLYRHASSLADQLAPCDYSHFTEIM